MKTYVQISCENCHHSEVCVFRGVKDIIICSACRSSNPKIEFVEWINSEWIEIPRITTPNALSTHYVNKVAQSLIATNSISRLEMAREVSTSGEIYKSLDNAAELINHWVSEYLSGVKMTNHLMDVMMTSWSISQDFDENVQTFLDAVIKDIARNPDNHKLYDFFNVAWPFGQFIYNHFPDLPDEYTDDVSKGVSDFLHEYSLADTIFSYEERAGEMLE